VGGNSLRHSLTLDNTAKETKRSARARPLYTGQNTIASFNMPTISHLPIEILCSIASLLDVQDFSSFRQTSWLIHNSTISQFATQFFKRRCIFLQRRSLGTLLDIAHHPVFGPTVHTLDVSIAYITEDPEIWGPDLRYSPEECDNVEPDEEPSPENRDSLPSSPPSEDSPMADGASSPERTQVNTDAYNRYRDDQRYMTECGMDTAYLSLALAALPNCRAIVLSAWDRPWGARPLAQQMGLWPTADANSIEGGDFARRALHVVLAAAVTSRISLEELDILFFDPDSGIRPHEFVSELAAQQIHSCLVDLNTLRLTVRSEDSILSDGTAGSLVQFLELFPTVDLLELRMGGRNKPALFTAVAGSLHMTALRDLELHWVNCTADALAKILCCHQSTLKDVLFNGVHIREDRGWQLIFCVLRDKLSVENLVVVQCLSAGQRVRFRNPGGEERGIQIQCDWDSLTSAMNRIVLERVEDPWVRSRFQLLE
jgi:hypothetical protein